MTPPPLMVTWPVLRFGAPDCSVARFDSEERLCTVTYKGFGVLRHMHDYFIVDSDGRKTQLRRPRTVTRLSAGKRLFLRVTNRRVPIVYEEVIDAGRLSLEQLRLLVRENWQEHREFWEAYDLDKLEIRLSSASTFLEIINLF